MDALPRYTSDTNWALVPMHMVDSVRRYVENGILPGGFLTSVLSNDLRGAVQRADSINRHRLECWVNFMMGGLPGNSWGSPENVRAWVARRGLQNLPQTEEIDT